jgi:hypothetical protein
MKLLLYLGVITLFLAGCSAAPQVTSPRPPVRDGTDHPSPAVVPEHSAYILADAHLHLVDFLQGSQGIDAVVAAMDRAGVSDAMITGMPLVKKWEPQDPRKPLYYLDDDSRAYWYSATDVLVALQVLSLPEPARKRFHPFITGFNGADMNALDHIQRMIEWYPGFWQGIGEIMARHDDLTALTYGETARANSPSLARVYEFAAEHDLPVSIHSNIGSVWLREPVYLHEMEEAVKGHPKTRFIWCHAGISRRIVIPSLVSHLRRLVQTHKNLWIDISWVVFDDVIAPHGEVDPAWVSLIEEFPTRFMIGSDKVGRFDDYSSEIVKYDRLLARLTPTAAKQVAHDNFLSILPGKGNTAR